MARALCSAAFLVLLATTLSAEKKDVTIAADDGFPLKATWQSAGKSGPGVLLLHQCNADRRIYDNLGAMLGAAGYNVIALDFRGFGESSNAKDRDLATSREQMAGDVDGALRFLSSQELVNKTLLGIVGGSCGVNHAIQAARRHPEVRTLVLLSGSTDADGEAFIRSSAKFPIFGAASEEDAAAAASIKKIVGLSANKDSQLILFKDAGHAASMFIKQPDLEADIVIWFRNNLPVAGYATLPSPR
jgi:pimeloyl-ACP methyl ester carboxylesterase